MTISKLNETQRFLFEQIREILFCASAKNFINEGCVDYLKIKSALYAKHPSDANLKVWDLVLKHYSDKKVVLNKTKKLSLPLAFDGVVCFCQKEFR